MGERNLTSGMSFGLATKSLLSKERSHTFQSPLLNSFQSARNLFLRIVFITGVEFVDSRGTLENFSLIFMAKPQFGLRFACSQLLCKCGQGRAVVGRENVIGETFKLHLSSFPVDTQLMKLHFLQSRRLFPGFLLTCIPLDCASPCSLSVLQLIPSSYKDLWIFFPCISSIKWGHDNIFPLLVCQVNYTD